METEDALTTHLLTGYEDYRNKRRRRVEEYRAKGGVAKLVARSLSGRLRQDIKIVEAFESVPAARISAAQNEANIIIF
jgi:hypothetical protein